MKQEARLLYTIQKRLRGLPVISVDLVNIMLGFSDKVSGIPLQHFHLHPARDLARLLRTQRHLDTFSLSLK
jgi:hypothetical protein